MIITMLGTGTSHGIPVAGCTCPVCLSEKKENKRYRCSLWIRNEDSSVLIDTAPEFRLQAVRAGIRSLDGVLITHSHADHLHGIDDLRAFCWKKTIPMGAQDLVCGEIKERFPYLFQPPAQEGGGLPQRELRTLPPGELIRFGSLDFQPVPVMHGKLPVYGYRCGGFAYVTDCSSIPDSSLALLKGLDVLVLGALRFKPHDTHFSIPEALDIIKKISPKRAYLTHICHDVEHFRLKDDLPEGIEPAWDGLEIAVP
jgi:phosphoribosyl 1,2-cyclic phosphate phosphodiesterase